MCTMLWLSVGKDETETACLCPITQPNPCTTAAGTIEVMQRRGVQRYGAGVCASDPLRPGSKLITCLAVWRAVKVTTGHTQQRWKWKLSGRSQDFVSFPFGSSSLVLTPSCITSSPDTTKCVQWYCNLQRTTHLVYKFWQKGDLFFGNNN